MSRYEVDVEQVSAASSKVAGSVNTIRAEVTAMMAHLHDLEAGWRGSAATAFSGLMQQWAGTQAQVEDSLDDITAALAQAAQIYAQTEESNRQLFSR